MADPEDAVEQTSEPPQAAPEAGGDAPQEASEAARGVVFLDPELSPEACAALATTLGWDARVVSPDDLDPAVPRETDRALVVPLNLATQSGLDLVEALRRREHGHDVTIAVADEQPTRRKVVAALRAGASTFVQRPYDPAELQERLGHVFAQEEAPDGAEDPAAGVAD